MLVSLSSPNDSSVSFFFFNQNVSVLIDQKYSSLVNQQFQIQGLTKREQSPLVIYTTNH